MATVSARTAGPSSLSAFAISQIPAGELKGLRQICLPGAEGRRAMRADLKHDYSLIAGRAKPAKQLRTGLSATPWHQVLVWQPRLRAVPHVHVCQAPAELLCHRKYVG